MTQDGTLRDWAAQVKLVNKAFAQREAELKAELAQQRHSASEALDATAAKIAEIENLLSASRAELMALHHAATEQEAGLRDAAAQAARASAEQVSNSELVIQELTQQLATLQGHKEALDAELAAVRAQHDLAVAQAAEREQGLRTAQTTAEQAASAAEERATQIEARCQSLSDQIAAAAQRERSAQQALDEARKNLAAGQAQSQDRESAQLEKIQSLALQAEQSRAAHAAELQAANLALRVAQERHDQGLAQLQSALQEQQLQLKHLATQRESAMAQLGALQDTNNQLQARSTAREREWGAQLVQALEKAGADAHKHLASLAAREVQHEERMRALQAEMLAVAERGRLQVEILQAHLISAHEVKAIADREGADRERSLRADMQAMLAADLARAEAYRRAQQQETRIYLAQLAERDGLHAAERKDWELRALAAAEALAALHARYDGAQAELALARQEQLRLQAQSELREQLLRSEQSQLQAAARHELEAAQGAWAVQQDGHLQHIQTLTEALSAARDEGAQVRAVAAQELAELQSVRQSQAAELAAQSLQLAQSLALAVQLRQELDELRTPVPQRRASFFRWAQPAAHALPQGSDAQAPILPVAQVALAPASRGVALVPLPMPTVHLAVEPTALPAPSAVDQPVSSPMTTYKSSDTPYKHMSQLLALHGAAFVTAAYRSVLGREPDAPGAAYFLSRVDTEHNKPAILYELATSEEGRARPQSLSGLDELVASRNPAQSRLRRWLNKIARIEQTSIRIEWAIAAFSRQSEERLQAIDSKLVQIVQGRQQLDARLEGRVNSLEARLTQVAASLQQLHENLGAGLANQGRHNAESLHGLAQRLGDSQHTQNLIADRLRACEDMLIASTQKISADSVGDATPSSVAAPAAPAAAHAAPRALDCTLDASQGALSLIQSLATQLANSAEAAALSAR